MTIEMFECIGKEKLIEMILKWFFFHFGDFITLY